MFSISHLDNYTVKRILQFSLPCSLTGVLPPAQVAEHSDQGR